ncbi:hypothetical protein BGX27_008310 [Mortierella sp. AM989]|nr:hypothetical protein BGX27_008310 [Mortierella sp. AM989]
MTPSNLIAKHHESLPIDLILPGHLPDSTDLEIGKIRYELQISLELVHAQGTSVSSTERFILRRPVLIHRIVYPSAHLQPRLAMGLDSGGVEIQVKVPRLLHCENTLLAVELYVKPRTRNVKLRKAKIVFEQIETDRAIAQPLEVEFEELTTELQTQILNLQLVLSPELCVDVQSSWIQICHTLRVEVEYTTDEESYVMSPPTSVPPISLQELESREEQMFTHLEQDKVTDVISIFEQAPTIDNQEDAATIWDQEGDAIETGVEDQEQESVSEINGQPVFSTDKKALLEEEGTGPSTVHSRDFELDTMQTAVAETDSSILLPTQSKGLSRLSKCSSGSASSSYTYSLATEEIPVRVVRVVSTALVDASTLAQAAGETEAGLPTYESVIEATGLPAYAEEKIEDDHEEAEASGTVTGVLGGAARRLEGEDAEIERR